jgi:hypothetical protein
MRMQSGHDTTFIMRRTWTAPAIPDSVRTDTVESMVKRYVGGRVDEVSLRNAFHVADIPTTGPSFSRLFVDDKGNSWAQQALGADSTRFDVFGPDGRWLGPVVVPIPVSPYAPLVIKGGAMYLATEDADGFPEVRRWAIQDGQGEQGEQEGR